MWKSNWEDTKSNFTKWWKQEGLLIGMWGAPESSNAHETVQEPLHPLTVEELYTDTEYRAIKNHYNLANRDYPGDCIPIAQTDIGPGSTALFLGAEPGFSEETVWFCPVIQCCENPEELPPFTFNPSNKWWSITVQTITACAKLAQGNYFVGCPDLVENIDVLASLRGSQHLMMDMVIRPDWVCEKVMEINKVWFEVYSRIYEIIKQEDGGSAFGAFQLWGPGKMAKVQCDASAMFSPEMFAQFVVPALKEQCEWLDFSMYHLDGTQAMIHLDQLLEIEALDAIEWTPQPGIGGGGNPRWYDMYEKILSTGKSIQVFGVSQEEILPLLDKIGGRGVYILTEFKAAKEAEDILKRVESYR